MGILKATGWIRTDLFFDIVRAPLGPKYLRMFRHLLSGLMVKFDSNKRWGGSYQRHMPSAHLIIITIIIIIIIDY
jgi:hypothetical protein